MLLNRSLVAGADGKMGGTEVGTDNADQWTEENQCELKLYAISIGNLIVTFTWLLEYVMAQFLKSKLRSTRRNILCSFMVAHLLCPVFAFQV